MASYNDQEQILEADTYTYSDTEGYVSDSCGESTQSLTSSANEYIIENGIPAINSAPTA